MAAGLIIRNDASQLVLTSDALVFGYVGQATRTATVQPTLAGGIVTGGYSTYTINWPGDFIAPVVKLSTTAGAGYIVGIRNIVKSGSTWTITIFAGNNTYSQTDFLNQTTAAEVYVWGTPYAAGAGAFGLQIFDAAGVITADLSRQPLAVNSYLAFSNNATSAVMPASLTTPGIMTASSGFKIESVAASGSYTVTESLAGFHISGTTVYRVLSPDQRYSDDVSTNNTYLQAETIGMIDLAQLL